MSDEAGSQSQETTSSGLFSTETQVAAADGTEQVAQVEAAPQEEQKAEGADAAKVEETEKKVQPEEDKKFAAKFAALSRREKALRQRERDLEKRMAELESKLKASEPKAVEQESLELRLKKDPFTALKDLGYDFDTLTKIALNEGKLTPEMQLKLMQEEIDRKYGSEVEGLKKRLEEKEKKEEETRQAQIIQQFKEDISEHILSNKDAYELISVEGEDGVESIYEVISEHYNSTGEIMDVKEAADLVEEYLLEEAKKRLELGKLKKLISAQTAPQKTEQKTEKRSVTLSNSQATQVAPARRAPATREEALLEAAKLVRWDE